MDRITQLFNIPPTGTAPISLAEIEALLETRNPTEWNATVAEIEAGRGGHYPPDWWAAVEASGLHHKLVELWALRDAVRAKFERD